MGPGGRCRRNWRWCRRFAGRDCRVRAWRHRRCRGDEFRHWRPLHDEFRRALYRWRQSDAAGDRYERHAGSGVCRLGASRNADGTIQRSGAGANLCRRQYRSVHVVRKVWREMGLLSSEVGSARSFAHPGAAGMAADTGALRELTPGTAQSIHPPDRRQGPGRAALQCRRRSPVRLLQTALRQNRQTCAQAEKSCP